MAFGKQKEVPSGELRLLVQLLIVPMTLSLEQLKFDSES